jgi:hypothetical protein
MIKARPLSCDLRESHKKAGSFRSSRKATFLHINQLSFLQSYTVCALLRAPFFLLFCCQVMFCALVYFVWVFVLSQFPSHTTLKGTIFVWEKEWLNSCGPESHEF